MEIVNNCPVCNSSDFSDFIKCIDYTVSRETFQIVSCNNCKFKFTNPRPLQSEIGKYYQSDDYISHSNSKKGAFNLAYHFVRNLAINRKIKLINSFNTTRKRLIDIGCGTGEFLYNAKKDDWETLGLEPSEQAREYAIKYNGLSVYNLDYFDNIPDQSFDVITMWHVLEHVPDLGAFLSKINRILVNNGTLLIAVPNADAFDCSYYKDKWAAYDVPRHLNHFSIDTMTKLLINNDLSIIKIITMPFDSFYISMLSEKYSGSGVLKMIVMGIINGLSSNLKAKRNPKFSSSLIYLIKKNY